MGDETLKRFIENAKAEMGPKIFRQFQDDLVGKKAKPVRQRKMTCGLCQGTGISMRPSSPGGPCDGCEGTGKF